MLSLCANPKTIIIGSGLAGLGAGLELAQRGFEVVLLEASPYLGGRTASWNGRNGCRVRVAQGARILHIFSQTGEESRIEDDGHRLIVEKNRMKCAEVNDKTNYPCDYVVMAASLNPAHQIINKPRQKTRTPVKGLFLAGDYVQQSFMASMEGAVISGNNAAHEVIAAEKSTR